MVDGISIASLVALLAMVAGAYYVGSILGFGTTILLVTFASQLFPLDVLLPLTVPLNILLGSYIVIKYRRHTKWRFLLRYALPLVALGVPLGLLLFQLRSVGYIKLGFGLFVTVLAVLQLRATLLKKKSSDQPLGRWQSIGMLLFGGLIHGLYVTGGPIVVYVLGRRIVDKYAFRSTVSTLFLTLAFVLITYYAVTGLVTSQVRLMFALSLPAMGLGMWLGELTFRRIDPAKFRMGIWLLLLAGGIILSVRAGLAL